MNVVHFPPREPPREPPPDDYEQSDADEQGASQSEQTAGTQGLPFVWVRDFGDLHAPEPLRWLLRDRRSNKPFMRAGECAVLAGDGGVGKGFFWLMVATCIALGRDVFDTFTPEQTGRVALLVAEDKQNEVHHRLHRIANALGLDSDELEQVRSRVGVMPLSGQQVNLLAVDPHTRAPARTLMFDALVKQLTDIAISDGFEWSLVTLDPLARFGSANAELDQSAATMFVQTLELMAERLPGRPAIGVTHHSSAASVSAGKANLRGVTGLRNAFRLVMIVDAYETTTGIKGVLLRNDKNNLAPKADPLWLVRLDNEPMGGGRFLETAGVLRRATEDESKQLDAVAGTTPAASKEQRQQAKQSEQAASWGAECDVVLSHVPAPPSTTATGQIDAELRATGIRLGDKKLKSILEHLARAGRIRDLSSGAQAKPRQWTTAG